jgi:hypothetical protein
MTCQISLVLFHLQISFSTDIANNLIEKHETSAAGANIHAVKAAADGGSEE